MFVLVACVPSLLAYNDPPSPTFYNQAIALALWGVALILQPSASAWRACHALVGAVSVVLLALGVAWLWQELPAELALSAAGLTTAAWLVAANGLSVRKGPSSAYLLDAFFIGWILAGLCSAAIAVAQVFTPFLLDGELIARSGLPGRAVGNLRQPNHLSSLLLWSAAAVVPMLHAGRMKRHMAWLLFALMLFGIVLSGSRTGIVGMLVLAAWGALDKRLNRDARRLLLSAPAWFALFWAVMWAWARLTENTFGAAAHVLGAEISSSRFAIWSNTLALIARHPWTGVGFGEFNFAWSLTPFPNRPVAFFDHTHNLPLQLAVELGIPMALLVLSLLGWALWRAWRNGVAADGPHGVALRAAFVMVLMMALHSQLEYPLWYAYFLLPTAWLWGYCLGSDAPAVTPSRWRYGFVVAGVAMVVGAVISVADYTRVVQIFAPNDNAPPLAQRIQAGQRSIFFAHHADYAAVTTTDEPVLDPHAFDRAPYYLLDTRLMVAWAKSLAAQGKLDHARHLAQRLREFRNPASEEFFAPCAAPPPRPFQCEPPSRVIDWREFR